MVCKHCQRPINSDFKFCPYCGEPTVSDFSDLAGAPLPPAGRVEPAAFAPERAEEPLRPAGGGWDWPPEGEPPAPKPEGKLPYYVFRPEELPDPEPLEPLEPVPHSAPPLSSAPARPRVGRGAKCAVALLAILLGVGGTVACYCLANGGTQFTPADLSALFVRLWWAGGLFL